MDNCVKILIACHKPSPIPKAEVLFPVLVGKKGADIQMDIQGDDEGENISDKNYCYCELTALYWAWKNLKDVDVIGLCHYRRYFDFHGQCIRFLSDTSFPVSAISELDFSMDEFTLKKVMGGRRCGAKGTAMEQFHGTALLYGDTLVKTIKRFVRCFSHPKRKLQKSI